MPGPQPEIPKSELERMKAELEQQQQQAQQQPTPQPAPSGLPEGVQKARAEAWQPPAQQEYIKPPSESEAKRTMASMEVARKKIKEAPSNVRYEIKGESYTKSQVLNILNTQYESVGKYINKKREMEEYVSNLQDRGIDARIDPETGKLDIEKPEGISDLEFQKILIEESPRGRVELTINGKTKTFTKQKAIELINKGIRLEEIEKELKEGAGSPFWTPEFWEYVWKSTLLFGASPLGMGSQYLTEASVYFGGITPLILIPGVDEKIEQWQRDLTKERFEKQSQLYYQWEEAISLAKEGKYSKLIEMTKGPILEWGTIIATAYIGSAGVGAITGYAEATMGATITIPKLGTIATSKLVSTAMKASLGGILAYQVGSTVARIYNLEQQELEIQKKYEQKIKIAKNTEERKNLEKRRDKEIETIKKQKYEYARQIAAIGIFILLSYGVAKYGGGEKAYRYGYERGYQFGWTKSRFGLTTPKGKLSRYTFKTIRALEKGTIKQYNPLERTKVTGPRKTSEILRYAKLKQAEITGSGATYTQVPKGRFPKDIDLYMQKFEQIRPAQQKFGSGVDIHGGPGYYPSKQPAHIRLGVFQQKPVSFKGVQYQRITEQIPRKGTTKLQLMAGEEPKLGRVKDIGDFYSYSRQQIQTMKEYGTAKDYISALRAEYYLAKSETLFKQIYGEPPYIFKDGKLASGTKIKVIQPITKPTTLEIAEAQLQAVKTGKPIDTYYPGAYPKPLSVIPYPSGYPISQPPRAQYPTSIYTPTKKITYPTVSYPIPTLIKPGKPQYPKPEKVIPSKITPPPTKPILYTPTKKKKKKSKEKVPGMGKRLSTEKPSDKGFYTYVKKDATKKARYIKVTDDPVTEKQALGIGAKYTDETVSRTFYIKPAPPEEEIKSQPKYNMTWAIKRHQFRKPVKGGKKVKSKRWIEKTRYAIDTPGEIQGITVKGLQALEEKRKAQTFQLTPQPPTKTTQKLQKRPSQPKTPTPSIKPLTFQKVNFKPVKFGGI